MLTPYGCRGKRTWVSATGTSSSVTNPYSALEQATTTTVSRPIALMVSKIWVVPRTLVSRVLTGSSHETVGKLWAAR